MGGVLAYRATVFTLTALTFWTYLCGRGPSLKGYCLHLHSTNILNLSVTLTLNIATQFSHSHSGLWWCTIKIWLQKGSALWNIQQKQAYFDYVNPHCDLQVSTSVFPHGILSDDGAPPYLVWLQTVQWFRRYQSHTILTVRHSDCNTAPTCHSVW